MNRASTWCRKKVEAASGGDKAAHFAVKISLWAIFAANDSKIEKKR